MSIVRATKTALALMIACLGAGLHAQHGAELQSTAAIGAAADGTVPLFLAVTINGHDTGLVAEFAADLDGGNMRSTRDELAELGIKAPRGLGKSVRLSDIEGLRYSYDAAGQAVNITAPFADLLPEVISAARAPAYEQADSASGAVLNYSLVAEHGVGAAFSGTRPMFSASFDGWLFSHAGRLRSTGFISRGSGASGQDRNLRLETAFTADLPAKALNLTFGDLTTTGPTWVRPIRMGGIALRRDFSLRSDIVTDQRLSYAGAAAVPSTVDVFIENNRVFSAPVSGGPFQLEDVPIQGSGDAEIVVRGTDGQVNRRTVSFFSSEKLLKKGRADYSVALGFAREGFGLLSNGYGDTPILSASLRYGLTKTLTLGGHVSATSELRLVGTGLTMIPWSMGELSLAVASSDYRNVRGGFGQLDFHTEIGGIDLRVSTSRADRGYADLAYVTGLDYLSGAGAAGTLLEVPLAQDVISMAIPVGRDNRRIGISYVSAQRAGSRDRLAAISFGNSLKGGRGSLSLNGAYNLETEEMRVTFGLSLKLAKRTYARMSVYTDTSGRQTQDIAVSRTMGEGIGAYGYHLQAARRDGRLALRAKGDIRSRYGKLSAEAQTEGGNTYLRAELDGAAVIAGGKTAFGNQVGDGFAVVDVGVPDIPVYLDNRPVALTNGRGRVLVGGLNAYRGNRVSVNVRDLPETATLGVSAIDIVPSRGSGQYVSFGGNRDGGVLVVLKDAAGHVLPAGSLVYANGDKTEAYIGYDGETWVEAPRATNVVRVQTSGGSCEARFGFTGSDAVQDMIGPVVCR